MDMITLTLLAFFGIGGAWAGASFSGFFGAIIGGPLGIGVYLALSTILGREADRVPPCLCGAPPEQCEMNWDSNFGMIWICNICLRKYTQRAGKAWFFIDTNNQMHRTMKRTLLGRWKPI